MRNSRLKLSPVLQKIRLFSTLVILVVVFGAPGCLKTRSQLKNESGSHPEEQAGGDQKPKTGVRYELDEIKNEILRLTGRIEEVAHAQKADQSNSSDTSVLETRIAEIEKTQILILTELKALKESRKIPAADPTDLIKEGNKLLRTKKYDQANEKFKQATQLAKGSELAKAYFGLGESEYRQKNYKKAIVAYSKVQESSSKSKLVPSSLYKIGLSFQHLNMRKEAKGFFSDLVDRYPKSTEAKKAKRKLKN